MDKRLYKSATDKKLDGVCAGIAAYFSIDPTLVRILWVLFTACSAGAGILAYIACSLIIPRETGN